MNQKKIIYSLVIWTILHLTACQETMVSDTKPYTTAADTFNYLPTSTTGVVISHRYYNLSYNEKYENPEWVAYRLTPSQISRRQQKRPWFKRDPLVKSKSAGYKNYYPNGYEKGHLLPAADRRFSKQAFDETFYTSNVSPMKHEFNGGIWNDLEKQVRYWTKYYGPLYVVTGGVLTPDLHRIGREKVAVPKFFYKIILLKSSKGQYKSIAFLIPQNYKDKDLKKYMVTIDSLEKLTDIDFFPALPDTIEDKLEAVKQTGKWHFVHFKSWHN